MTRYLVMRLLMGIPTVLGVTTLMFLLMRTLPGDPALFMLGDYYTEEAYLRIRQHLGLDQPIHVQFLVYVGNVLTGDFGISVIARRPVMHEVMAALPYSAVLAGAGLVIAIAIGIPIGVMSAQRQGTWTDHTLMTASVIGISAPSFWLGLVLILVFAHYVKLFPSFGPGREGDLISQAHHLALPALVLGVGTAAYLARITRSAMLEVVRQDYIRTARAKGLGERRVTYRHALKNALVPVLAVLGVALASALGGTLLVEIVFARPGMGTLLIKSVFARDYQVVQAIVIVIGVLTVLVNIALDVMYTYVDPRLRHA